ncbi:MAG: HEAT repeat domain-containing protein [Armatimonadetes bacterium]|nr:HEAT repeat domain-containing protein [Armatimonadota bacterium]
MANRIRNVASVVTLCVVLSGAVQMVDGDADTPGGPSSPKEVAKRVALHDAGLKGDQEALPQLLAALRHEHHAFRRAALFALGRLEDPKAIPDLLAMAEDPKTVPEERPYALAVAARSHAAASGRATNLATLGRQMQAVLQGVGLTPQEVYDAVGVVRGLDEDHELPAAAAARAALRQVADMALCAADRGLLHADQAAPLSVVQLPAYGWRGSSGNRTPGSYFPLLAYGLKMKLSDLPRGQARIDYLVDSMSRTKVLDAPADFLIQALANEGQAAVPTVIARLETMRKTREGYTNATFCGFFRALMGIGGAEATAAVKSFQNDPDGWVQAAADQACERLGAGHRSYMVSDY